MPRTICCPYCGSQNLKSIRGKDPDFDVNITAWNCLSCDSTFRDPDDTRMLMNAQRNAASAARVTFIIIFIVVTIAATLLIDFFGGVLVGAVGGLIIFGCYKLCKGAMDKRIEKLEAELSEVETGMRRFAK